MPLPNQQPGGQPLMSEEDKKKQQQPQAGMGAAVPPVKGAPGTSQQLRAGQAVGQRQGSGFTGVGRVLQANVGSQLGQQVAGRVAQAGQQTQQRLGQATAQFQAGMGQAQSQYQQQLQASQAALGNIAGGTATTPVAPVVEAGPESQIQFPQQAMVTPQPAAQPIAPDATQAYQTAIAGQYTGPTGLQGVENLQQQAALAQTMGEATQTAGGRMALLKQMMGRGTKQYGAAQSALDALILGKSTKELAEARKSVAGIPGQVETQEMLAAEQARQAGAETAGRGKELAQEAGAVEAQTGAQIKGQKGAYERGLESLYKKVQDEVKAGELSSESLGALKQLGMDENSQFYGLPLDQIANLISRKAPGEITEATSATEEQVRRMNALKKLAGQKAAFSAQEAQQAGTTLDPTKGLTATQELKDVLKKQKESFEKTVEGLFGEGEMASTKAYVAEQERVDRVNAEKAQRVESAKRLEAERKERVRRAQRQHALIDPKDMEPILVNPADLKPEVNRATASAFAYSPGKGNTAFNAELAKKIARGELYDKETGKLNTELATQLKGFLDWRRQYLGKEGMFGAGRYGRIAGDVERVQALEDLLKRYGTGKTFKKKEEPAQ